MFGSIEIPFESVMLFNVITLKPGVSVEDAELALGEMCNTVKGTYGNPEGGFIAGQVFKYAGFISTEGSVGPKGPEGEHLVIVTYWRSFGKHELSHADKLFKEKFSALAQLCSETKELGYELLWQGAPESRSERLLKAL
ncbi:MAG: hypothetical protein OEW39_08950 [Deltaproteobacteria bacterium]|nr:hypothetical protein [Deltaproteobacteria bacterium]